ncbi:heparinase II/III family protein, partial [Candidatus Omnitrophota bacterium]
SNHIAVIVSGLGLAATAIYGDDPENPSLEPYLSGILAKMKDFMDKTYFPEGSYGEPYTYQAMASRDLTETLCALERNFGIDYTSTTDLKDLYIYPLYATHSNGRYQDFGDVSLWYGRTQTHFQWLAYKMKNPWTYAYVKPFWDSGRGGFTGYLWYTDGITPRYRDELPTSKLFADKGNMIMRSDWKDDGSIMIFKCGPNSNHYHLDQGTFVIMTNGQELLSDAGHSDGYYSNLYYPCYYTQAIGHNVMLVDKNPESQGIADYENGVAALRDYPQITRHFASDIADNVEGDLTTVYKGVLSAYTRSLLYMKPDILYVFDKVNSDNGHEYNWLFHAEHSDGKNAITFKDNRVTIIRSKANLTMDVIAPRIASHTIRDSDRDESYIMLSSEIGQTGTAFLAVLSPSAGTNPTSITSTLIEGDGWIGARSELKSTVAVGMFSLDGREKGLNADGIHADAERCAVVMDNKGRIERYIIRGKRLAVQDNSKIIFLSDEPVSAAAAYDEKKVVMEIDKAKASAEKLAVLFQPTDVTINGSSSDDWTYDKAKQLLEIQLPEGHSTCIIKK